jgi:hypothetical protein
MSGLMRNALSLRASVLHRRIEPALESTVDTGVRET